MGSGMAHASISYTQRVQGVVGPRATGPARTSPVELPPDLASDSQLSAGGPSGKQPPDTFLRQRVAGHVVTVTTFVSH